MAAPGNKHTVSSLTRPEASPRHPQACRVHRLCCHFVNGGSVASAQARQRGDTFTASLPHAPHPDPLLRAVFRACPSLITSAGTNVASGPPFPTSVPVSCLGPLHPVATVTLQKCKSECTTPCPPSARQPQSSHRLPSPRRPDFTPPPPCCSVDIPDWGRPCPPTRCLCRSGLPSWGDPERGVPSRGDPGHGVPSQGTRSAHPPMSSKALLNGHLSMYPSEWQLPASAGHPLPFLPLLP